MPREPALELIRYVIEEISGLVQWRHEEEK